MEPSVSTSRRLPKPLTPRVGPHVGSVPAVGTQLDAVLRGGAGFLDQEDEFVTRAVEASHAHPSSLDGASAASKAIVFFYRSVTKARSLVSTNPSLLRRRNSPKPCLKFPVLNRGVASDLAAKTFELGSQKRPHDHFMAGLFPVIFAVNRCSCRERRLMFCPAPLELHRMLLTGTVGIKDLSFLDPEVTPSARLLPSRGPYGGPREPIKPDFP